MSMRDISAYAALVEHRPKPLVLFGGEDDGRARRQGGEVRDSPRPPNQRLQRNPAKIDRVRARLTGPQPEARAPGKIIQAIEAHDRKRETARQLRAAGFCRSEHLSFVDQRPSVGQLAFRLEVQHRRTGRNVVQERRPRRIEIGGVVLHAWEC